MSTCTGDVIVDRRSLVSRGHVFTAQLYTSGWACMRREGDGIGREGRGGEGREGGREGRGRVGLGDVFDTVRPCRNTIT